VVLGGAEWWPVVESFTGLGSWGGFSRFSPSGRILTIGAGAGVLAGPVMAIPHITLASVL